MGLYQKMVEELINQAPYFLLNDLLEKKLKEAGIKPSRKLIAKLSDHIRNKGGDTFTWGKTGKNVPITLSFSDQDTADIEQKISRLYGDGLTDLISDISESFAQTYLNLLKKSWTDEYALQQEEFAGFQERLEDRWGKPLNLLRMLLTIAREMGADFEKRNKRKKFSKTHLFRIIVYMHCRACQITAEIVVLLENGYADGAMARWRTLHEVHIVTAALIHLGEEAAKQFVEHECIEAKRALDDYERCYIQLGYRPLSSRQKKQVTNAYEAALKKYGKNFKGSYGWAAREMKKSNPTLDDLEKLVDRNEMRSHYQMASYNVHASPKGIFFRLGLLETHKNIIAGASNAGLTEPGQNAAHTLTQITYLLYAASSMTYDDSINLNILMTLRDEIPQAFEKADTRLRRDEARLHRDKKRG